MKIKWFGHACFKLVSDEGISVITDPYDESVGYKISDERADIVTISHGHFDHSCTKWIGGNPQIIRDTGEFRVKSIIIKGIKSYHDEVGGSKRGKNNIYVIEMDEIRVCHLGDLGHVLDDGQVAEIGEVDVLLIPVGGTFTIDAEEAVKVIKQINPRIVIPMHYKTPSLSFAIDSVDTFLNKMPGTKQENNVLEVTREGIGEETKVIVLNYE